MLDITKIKAGSIIRRNHDGLELLILYIRNRHNVIIYCDVYSLLEKKIILDRTTCLAMWDHLE